MHCVVYEASEGRGFMDERMRREVGWGLLGGWSGTEWVGVKGNCKCGDEGISWVHWDCMGYGRVVWGLCGE